MEPGKIKPGRASLPVSTHVAVPGANAPSVWCVQITCFEEVIRLVPLGAEL